MKTADDIIRQIKYWVMGESGWLADAIHQEIQDYWKPTD